MYNYFSFIAKPGRELTAEDAIKFHTQKLERPPFNYSHVYTSPTLHILQRSSDRNRQVASIMEGQCGVILGTLFKRTSSIPLRQLPYQESKLVIETSGRHLINHYWGRYIAFWKGYQSTNILIDPIGGLDCYLYENDHFLCVFSDTIDFMALNLVELSIDLTKLSVWVSNPSAEFIGSPLTNIRTLQPGVILSINSTGSNETLLWSMADFYTQSTVTQANEGADLLKEAVLNSTQAWATVYERFMVLQSGGLDSNIVLGCLRESVPAERIVCLHHYADYPESDERFYARAAARRFGTLLIEREDEPKKIDISLIEKYRFSAEPRPSLENAVRGSIKADVANKYSLPAMFTGHMGDAVFGLPTAPFSAIDFWRERRFSKGFFNALYNTARLRQTTIWREAIRAMRSDGEAAGMLALSPIEKDYDDQLNKLLPGYERDHLQVLPARVGDLQNQIPPGKLLHFFAMSATNRFWEPAAEGFDIEHVHPLLSQPVIEAACSIPVPLLCHGARVRGLARHAFENYLPPEITFRLSKAGANGLTDDVFIRNHNFLRSFYLDGVLVKEGLLNRSALEHAFSKEGGKSGVIRSLLLSRLSIEAWARQWA